MVMMRLFSKRPIQRVFFTLSLCLCANTFAQGIFVCEDAYGNNLTSDRLIPECLDRTQRELNPSGTVRRIIGPNLTERERRDEAIKAQLLQDDQNRLKEERRRDRALAVRYPDQASHDAERNKMLQQAEGAIQESRKHLVELDQELTNLRQEFEFYKLDPSKAPGKLQRSLAVNEQQTQEHRRIIKEQSDKKAKITQEFDKELEKLRPLWQGMKEVAEPPAPIKAPGSGR